MRKTLQKTLHFHILLLVVAVFLLAVGFFLKEIHCPNMFHSTDILSSATQTLFSLRNTCSQFVILVPLYNKIKTHTVRLKETQTCTQRL